jgi:hypothetical protein
MRALFFLMSSRAVEGCNFYKRKIDKRIKENTSASKKHTAVHGRINKAPGAQDAGACGM